MSTEGKQAGNGTDGEGSSPADEGASIGNRGPELALALLLMLVAVVVIVDAKRLGTGWDEFDGPRAGYFPFYVGCLLLVASGWIALRQLLAWKRDSSVFASTTQLGSVWAMVWPMTVYVGLIQLIGIYIASALLIGYFMRRHGKYGWPALAAVSVGVPLFFFVVFERYFLVALPKGPIEALLGL